VVRRFNAAAALGIKDAVLIPNPAGAFSAVRGLVNPGKGWGLRGLGGQPRPVFLLCHEQRLAQTKPRHGGGLPGAGLAGPPVSREGIKNEGP
jgi:hypothetical protein